MYRSVALQLVDRWVPDEWQAVRGHGSVLGVVERWPVDSLQGDL